MGKFFPDTIGWHITNAENLRFTNADHTMIDCEADFSHVQDGPYPFSAYKFDTEKHGRDMFDALNSGDYGPVSPYEKSDEQRKNELIAAVRRKRLEEINALDADKIADIESGKIASLADVEAAFRAKK